MCEDKWKKKNWWRQFKYFDQSILSDHVQQLKKHENKTYFL